MSSHNVGSGSVSRKEFGLGSKPCSKATAIGFKVQTMFGSRESGFCSKNMARLGLKPGAVAAGLGGSSFSEARVPISWDLWKGRYRSRSWKRGATWVGIDGRDPLGGRVENSRPTSNYDADWVRLAPLMWIAFATGSKCLYHNKANIHTNCMYVWFVILLYHYDSHLYLFLYVYTTVFVDDTHCILKLEISGKITEIP